MPQLRGYYSRELAHETSASVLHLNVLNTKSIAPALRSEFVKIQRTRAMLHQNCTNDRRQPQMIASTINDHRRCKPHHRDVPTRVSSNNKTTDGTSPRTPSGSLKERAFARVKTQSHKPWMIRTQKKRNKANTATITTNNMQIIMKWEYTP